MIYRNLVKLATAMSLMGCLFGNAWATSFDLVNVDGMVDEAELVFEGVVTEVSYKNAESAGKDDADIPHTYVTFEIEKVFKGSAADGSQITLRFQGGPDGNGNMMLIPGVPLFDVGDRDVMFVAKNGDAICPLVGWEQGRMRQINGEMYTEQGRELYLGKDGGLVKGRVNKLESFLLHQMGDLQLTFELEPISPEVRIPVDAVRLRTDELGQLLTNRVNLRINEGRFLDLKPVFSANPSERLVLPAMPVGAAPQAPVVNVVPDVQAEELNELQLDQQ